MERRDFLRLGLNAGLGLGAGAGLALAGAKPLRAANAGAHPESPFKPRDLYEKDRSFTDFARGLQGRRVTFRGFMAPPLKADAGFFVLTQRPMAVCPFCESEAEWPDDILAVYTKRPRIDVTAFNVKIEARGRLEIGSYRDAQTGFLSLVRLMGATYG